MVITFLFHQLIQCLKKQQIRSIFIILKIISRIIRGQLYNHVYCNFEFILLHFHGLGDFLLIRNLYLCNDKLCDWLGLVQWTEDCWSHYTRMQLELPPISGQTTTWGTLVSPKTRCYGEVDRSHANSSKHQHCSRLMYFFIAVHCLLLFKFSCNLFIIQKM